MMYSIRDGMVTDAQAVWELMNQIDHETKFMMYEPGERPKNLEHLCRLLEHRESAMFLLTDSKGYLAGYLMAQRGSQTRVRHSAYIVTGILKQLQGRGLGNQLLLKLDTWALEHKVTRLELTVMCENQAAIHLYEKHGFAIEGVKKNSMIVDGNYVDEYYMGKMLSMHL